MAWSRALSRVLRPASRHRAIRMTALGLAAGLMLTIGAAGCANSKVAVKALARGATSASPFFRTATLAVDLLGTISTLEGGSKSGATPGLYGGTRKKSSCNKGQLIKYLKENADKAASWAEVQGINVKQIEGYIKKLTPVLLRNDTLVKNFDFDARKKKPKSFYALLEAGVAVLIDAYGVPVVQCRCGNPMRAFDKSRDDVDINFDGDKGKTDGGSGKKGKEWKGFDKKKIVKVESAEEPLDAVILVEHTAEGTGLERPTGTAGEKDQVLEVDPAAEDDLEVPDVVGKQVEEAGQTLREAGFVAEPAAAAEGEAKSAEAGQVVRQDPQAGTVAVKGTTVTLYLPRTPGGPAADCAEVGVGRTAYDQIAPGSSGDLVAAAQCLLKAAGYDPGPVDGEFGEATTVAARSLQADYGLQTLGIVGPKTWTVLLARGDTPALEPGSNGEAVARVQRALTAALGETVVIDGSFGPATEEAVRSYQSARGLDPVGMVGPETWAALQAGQ
jgi:peptidoglycan hydrolase-like protein with peptidoglycan-binding domain